MVQLLNVCLEHQVAIELFLSKNKTWIKAPLYLNSLLTQAIHHCILRFHNQKCLTKNI